MDEFCLAHTYFLKLTLLPACENLVILHKNADFLEKSVDPGSSVLPDSNQLELSSSSPEMRQVFCGSAAFPSLMWP